MSRRTANNKLTKSVLTITKALTKTTNCAFRAKKWRGTTKKKSVPPSLLLWTCAAPPTFEFVLAPLTDDDDNDDDDDDDDDDDIAGVTTRARHMFSSITVRNAN